MHDIICDDNFFTVFIDRGAGYEYKTSELKEYHTPATSLELNAGDWLYVGYCKPFKGFFLELETKSITNTSLILEYWNGSAWRPINVFTVTDETLGFSQSGFINFDIPHDIAPVNSLLNNYFIRIERAPLGVDTGPVTGKLLDIVFSSDRDLEKIRENIVSKFSVNGSWITKHIAARDHIIQEIRNRGNIKLVKKNEGLITEEILYKDITKFDFLDPSQLRIAAAYLALYYIFFFELSDEEGDKWQIKAEEMYILYEQAMNTFFISLDLDSDGEQGEDDKADTSAIRSMVVGPYYE